MSVIIKGMKMPQHVAVNGEKDTAYKTAVKTEVAAEWKKSKRRKLWKWRKGV